MKKVEVNGIKIDALLKAVARLSDEISVLRDLHAITSGDLHDLGRQLAPISNGHAEYQRAKDWWVLQLQRNDPMLIDPAKVVFPWDQK